MARVLMMILLSSVLIGLGLPLIHQLEIRKDDRNPAFRIETFAFYQGGTMNLTMKHFSMVDQDNKNVRFSDISPHEGVLGFVLRHTSTDTSVFFEEVDMVDCTELLVQSTVNDPLYRVLNIGSNWDRYELDMDVKSGQEGFYAIDFVTCVNSDLPKFSTPLKVNFDLDLVMINPGPTYLSAGKELLPAMYYFYFFAFLAALGGWCWVCYREFNGRKVHTIHHIMTAFLGVKCCALFFHAVEFHYISATGHPGGWAMLFFFFYFLKGIMMFSIIALIGSGWTFVKPFLSERDKKIFLIVIPLQVLSNIASIVVEEVSPGSREWFHWKDMFRLVDIICCALILYPIIQSIKHLKDAASLTDKTKRTVEKLQLFRHFYLLVVVYIYFTRLVVVLIDATLSYTMEWVGPFSEESAGLVFWIVTLYLFRPLENNPYLRVHISDLETESEDDEVVQMEELEGL